MDETKQKYYIDYLRHLCSDGTTFRKIGEASKYVLGFLDATESVSRKGFRKYKAEHSAELIDKNGALDCILDFLAFHGVGYKRKQRKVKALEKKSVIAERNVGKVNEFIDYLTNEHDFSEKTLQSYRIGITKFFLYADDFTQENVRRYIKTMEEDGMKPATINLRICALVNYSKFVRKPITVKRIKMHRTLSTDNIPTEKEYQTLIEHLRGKDNQDYYFWVRTLATTGLRLHEFLKLTWEDVASGEVVLKGKGGKFRQVFFQKSLQQEVKEYIAKTDKSGLMCCNRHGEPMSQRGFSESLKRWGKSSGIDKRKLHAHAFRHFFAKQFLKKNKDIAQLAELLGHSKLDTTMIYLQKSHDEQKREFNRNVTW